MWMMSSPSRGQQPDAWVTGSGARSLLSGLLGSRLPCPTGSSCLALQLSLLLPARKRLALGTQRVSARERQERNQSSVEERERERGREIEKEQESQTESGSTNGISGCSASGDNKQAWSLLAQACGRGKGQRVPWELYRCPWRQQLWLLPPFPHSSRTRSFLKSVQHTLHLEISGLNSAPKL